MQTIGITGGTGFVGQHLSRLLLSKGYRVIIFSTRPGKDTADPLLGYAHWDPNLGIIDQDALKQVNTMVHLAGAGIADKRWSQARKQEIVDSRVRGTDFIVAQLKLYATGCTTFIAASATGFYGRDTGGKPFTEDASPAKDFLGETCNLWEEASHKAESFLRTVILRLGIVLGKDYGAFAEFIKPMKYGIMPILGSGQQMVSWIVVTDLARMILFAIENQKTSGIYNAVAPNPMAHKSLMKTIAEVKGGFHIPAPVPAFVLKLMLGELSEEVLKSCTVSAQKITDAGFSFTYPDLANAVKGILAE